MNDQLKNLDLVMDRRRTIREEAYPTHMIKNDPISFSQAVQRCTQAFRNLAAVFYK